MRNPNGYGSVIKLKGNRRRPFMVRKTRGWNDKGHPIYDIIGYYATRKEAMLALADYNTNPYDIAQANMTVAELYAKWIEVKGLQIGESNLRNMKSAYKNHISALYQCPYKELRSFHIQEAITSCESVSMRHFIKNLFYHLDKFAFEIDLIDKCYAGLVQLSTEPPKTKKRIFSGAEIAEIRSNQNTEADMIILILLYTGLRIGELLALKKENINIKEWYFTAGFKTKAGKNRIIPIHRHLKPIFLKIVKSPDNQIFSLSATKVRKELKSKYNHIPHEARHTVRTLLARQNGDKVCIDRIMGHSSSNIGESIYTHKTLEELRATIELLD